MLGLCKRFGCLTSALLAEDAELLRWLSVAELGRPADRGPAGGE